MLALGKLPVPRTLRARIAAASGLSVALAVIAAAVGTYLAVRSDLRGGLDQSLRQRAESFVSFASGGPVQGPPQQGAGFPGAPGQPYGGRFPERVHPVPFGGASGYVQFVTRSGLKAVPRGQGQSTSLPVGAAEASIAAAGRGTRYIDRKVAGTDLRVLTIGLPGGGAVMVARPLTEVDSELHRILVLLLIIGAAGTLVAALLGALVARTALLPIARFTAKAETVSGGLDISKRLDVGGSDELGRLARSFNVTLDALERSLHAQRQLIADASHELRTPIASLRANIEVLEEESRLSPEERDALRRDVIEELDELTSLVADVLELARGQTPDGPIEQVRLDVLVQEAVGRSARRAPEISFELTLEPTVLEADQTKLFRAVANVIENARAWSPEEGTIEVRLAAGSLSVRDHGPGFAQEDLPYVFDRFYRAPVARSMPGSGLGLAIVRQTVESLGGEVSADNAPDGGAIVSMCFGSAAAPPDRRFSLALDS